MYDKVREPVTLIELLHQKAQNQSDKLAYTFLVDGETEKASLTYAQLEQQARVIATKLQSMVTAGERVLLLYPSGLDYIAAFFGCLYAGVIAVPAYPPRRNRSDQRLTAIAADAQATIILTTTEILSKLTQQLAYTPELGDLHWIATDDLALELAESWQMPKINSDTLAFLQYTSGSTGIPKGVMVSHGNLLHNLAYISQVWQLNPNSVMVTWLPIFHDMGLIFGILQPLYHGCSCYVMSSATFVQRPFRWLQALSRYQATHSGAPNFAYELCVNKITKEQRATLDLSAWEMSLNGAEPVRAETFQKFKEYFKPCGLRPTTLCHGYGLAEATLVIGGAKKPDLPTYYQIQSEALEQNRAVAVTENQSNTHTLVGCGHPADDAEVAIVNPNTLTRCSPNYVGEIWLKSPSVAQGYWQRSVETAETFQASLAETGEGPFLRTGDLGFLREDGELFVTGRLKDVIIIRGLNFYPQDIEQTVEQSHTTLRKSGAAAFSIEIADTEQLVVIQEVERTALKKLNVNEVIDSIRQAISEQHDLQVYAVLLLKPATLPKTSSGKVQRRAGRDRFLADTLQTVAKWQQDISIKQSVPPQNNHYRSVTVESIQTWFLTKLSEQLKISASEIDIQEPLARYGLDSMTAVSLSGELETWLERSLSPTIVYDYPSIQAISQYLAGGEPSQKTNKTPLELKTTTEEAIAIIGMGCRFPGAVNPEAFLQLLREGKEAITEVPASRWDIEAFYDPNPEIPGKMNTRWGGFLKEVAEFEPQFFGISPLEAKNMDPQQRLLLEVGWEALENASIAPENLAGSQTGVFVGISTDDYATLKLKHGTTPDAYSGTNNAFSIAANRLSYLWDLRGPSIAVDTACSSSLVAVHQACQSLRLGECHLALAGGVNLILTPDLSITFSQAGMLAADGHCKTFDANADGYVRGEGCGIVILKRVSDAIKDGDNILALIKGSALNQDGRTNGLTAPNSLSQQTVIRQALNKAGIAPEQISYIEAHGTGTSLGDPIEINALKEVLLENRTHEQFCWIGSVKTNIGHLEAAAGIAGLIKVILSLQHKEIFPHLHFKTLNPLIAIADTPLQIPTQPQTWENTHSQLPNNGRLAGVSSFGFGGTNAHLILAEVPDTNQISEVRKTVPTEPSQYLFTLSAKSEPALRQLIQDYGTYLQTHPQVPVANLCYTVNTKRSHFVDYRMTTVVESTTQLREQIDLFAKLEPKQWPSQIITSRFGKASRTPPKIAFLFTGQGSQYLGMAQQLYETQTTFRQILEQCDKILRDYLETPLLEILYPADPNQQNPQLDETCYTQPALFAIEYALAKLWQSWGITPSILIGHSIGEYVAACIAEIFSLEEGLKLIVERARLMQALPQRGEMIVIFADEAQVTATLAPYQQAVSIAAYNEPNSVVISGESKTVQTLRAAFEEKGIETRQIRVSHAFHSPLMEPMLDSFEQTAGQISFQKPKIPIISNLTGQLLEQAPDARYWRQHTRNPVRFMAGITTIMELGYEYFLEIGPKPVLSKLGQGCQPNTITATWLPSLKPQKPDWQMLLTSLSTLHVQGANINWAELHQDHSRRRLSSLPTYPFQRQRYWIHQKNPILPQTKLAMENPATMENSKTETTEPSIKDAILAKLCTLTAELLQITPAELEIERPLLEMGADSLIIGHAVRQIEATFGVIFTIRQIFEELNTLEALASYIEQQAPADKLLPYQPPKQVPQTIVEKKVVEDVVVKSAQMETDIALPVTNSSPQNETESKAATYETPITTPDSVLGQIMSQQLQVMSHQLNVLHSSSSSNQSQIGLPPLLPQIPLEKQKNITPKVNNNNQVKNTQPVANKTSKTEKPTAAQQKQKSNSPLPPWRITEIRAKGLSSQQQRHLEALIARYTQRTPKSKQLTQQNRPVLADSRASAGFRLSTKEMLYPIVGERAQGAKTWDIDGNEYIDITMGFGVNLFGHHPPFILEALEQQLQKTMQLGLQTPLAGQVAHLICDLTGMERVTFCNTGTEAVMTALRLARTATNRNKIVQFTMSYHGHFDGTLGEAQAEPEKLSTMPMAPGVTPNTVADTWVLDYGESQSLEIIRAHADEIAAVLVEPVQSRHPDLQPKTFLQQLRQLTLELGIPLIFDEMITGFRVHPGGAQAWFGVQADIATYGKIVGGGMPIGVIAGKAIYMDGIDGGFWNYGDASYPQANTTFFAGTFGKHPLAMATALAVLQQIKQQGPQLQEHLNQRTTYLVETLNDYFEKQQMPIRLAQFGSLFRFTYSANLDLLYYHLLEKGIYVWEGRNCFLSTEHTDEDIEYIIKAVKESVDELRQGGFLPPPTSPTSSSKKAKKAKKVPTQSQTVAKNLDQSTIERKSNDTIVTPPSLTKQPLPDYLSTPVEIKDRLTLQMEQWRDQLGVDDSGEIFSQLERLSIAYVLNAFQNLGWQFQEGLRFSTTWMANQLQVVEQHRPLLNRLLEMLAEEGWLRQVEKQWEVIQTPEIPISPPQIQQQQLLSQYSSAEAELTLLNRCAIKLAEVLRGECEPLQLLFPGGDLTTTTQLYQNSPAIRWVNTLAQKVVIEALARLPQERRVRILELGAGTGGTTAYILPHLPAQQTDYVFTDLSTWFTTLAKTKFGEYPFVYYQLLDIEQSPKDQGFELQSFDLVIAANVLHATQDLQHTLQFVQQLLVPGGLLILLEGTKKQRWLDLIFGLTEGWWRFTDHQLRPSYPLLSAAQWQDLLLANEFKEVIAFPPVEQQAEQTVLVAEKTHKIPLTEAQKQLWMLSQMEDEGSQLAYNFDLCLQLKGVFDLTAMQQAVQQVVNRHESLRTVISNEGDFQHCLSALPIEVPLLDLSELVNSSENVTQESKILKTAFFKLESRKPFNLTQGTLFRVHILKLAEQRHLFVLTVHHIVTDGLSMEIMVQEIGTFYSAICQRTTCQLESPLQFREYIQWQSQTTKMATQEAYWLDKFSDSIPVLSLPTDYPYPPIRSSRGNRQTVRLPAKLCHDLKALSQKQGCTVFMTLLAAYTIWLYRITGQNDILVGTPVSGRNIEGNEQLVGYCTHLLPILTHIEGTETFLAYLKTIRSILLEAYDHQDYPFAHLINKLNLPRDPSHTPLVSVIFNLDKPSELPKFFELEAEWFSQPRQFTAFDISINFTDFGKELVLDCDYSTDLFDATTIARFLEHFQILLEGIVSHPTQALSQFPLLTEAEQQQLLAWNQTETDYPKLTIVDLFQAQVEKTPNNIAVVFEEQQLSYQELNMKSNQLAHYLMTLGVGVETLVGICAERSLEMVISLLGVLKAGGAYVPFDPDYPLERLQFMLEDSEAKVLLLSQNHLLEKLPVLTAQVVYLDKEWEQIADYLGDNPTRQSGLENLAYVIYTSGSTGQPKGVMVEHIGLTNLIQTQTQAFNLNKKSCLLQFASFSFDASVSEMATTLTSGATLTVGSNNKFLPDEQFIDLINRQSITHVTLPPSFLATLPQDKLSSLKTIVVAGEACFSELVTKWSTGRKFINAYGPTESTVCATLIECQANGNSPSIGKPIANTHIYILDANHNITPLGIPGELCIGGVGLARGYLNRPKLTAEKFIKVKLFGKIERLYKTGDLARWLPEGNLEYLGRLDHQVKLRGFRIELGEIEATLSQHEAVKEAVVVLHNKSDNPLLVAYVTLGIKIEEVASILRAWLKARLPEYMLPANFTVLDKLPLTPNGKIDRKALPAPDLVAIQAEQLAPRTETELLLCHLWSQVLGIEITSINHNFFEVGGHSLLATQLVSRIRENFKINLPLRMIFEQPLLQEQADWLDKQQRSAALPSIMPMTADKFLVLSFAQQRLWFLAKMEGDSATYNMTGAFRLDGPLHRMALEQSLQEIVQRHESLRCCFPTVNGTPVVQLTDNYQLSVVKLSASSPKQQEFEVQQLLKDEAEYIFNLATGPLFRTTLLQLGINLHVLLINMHHIISDGWSIEILVHELKTLYEAFSQNLSSPLFPLPIQYSDFAYWQRQWLSGEYLEKQLKYWKQQLTGAPTLLELPTDHPRPPIQSFRGANYHFQLSEELTKALKHLSLQMGTTLFMTLLASFATLLSRYSGQSDIVIGSPIANRTHSQIESLIGFFVNTLVLRMDLEGHPDFAQLLHHVKQVALEAYAHQDIPFEHLVEDLKPARNLNHAPLFQFMFVLQNAQITTLELPEIISTFMVPETVVAKFDLTLSMEEVNQKLKGELEYNTDLFEQATIERMIGHFQTLLAGIVSNPFESIHKLPLLTDKEHRQFKAWNDTVTDYPSTQTIVDLFEQQVEKTPDNLAVVFDDQQLSYWQLNEKANQLAHYLLNLKTQAGKTLIRNNPLIAIGVERSLEMIIGLLGIIKAGGAYVPIDPAHPPIRIRDLLDDSAAPLLLTQSHKVAHWSLEEMEHDCIVVCLDDIDFSEQSIENPTVSRQVDDLAYVNYTSGSTGKQKGVCTPHQAICRLVKKTDYIEFSEHQTFLQLAPLAFDASTLEIWGSLLNGSLLVLMPPQLPSLKEIGQILHKYQVTTLWLTAGLFHLMVDERLDDLRGIKQLLAGGDVLSIKTVKKVLHELPNCCLINGYGPTENTTFTTCCLLNKAYLSDTVPIGKPIANTQVYVLDTAHQLVPIGVVGELCAAGAGLARGYLNRPELTSEKFIEIEIAGQKERIYKTGDLVRWRPDGNLEYLGRIDNQIKIRGFRIELGEIEAVLKQYPLVQDNAVLVQENANDKHIVAYMALQKGQQIDNLEELRNFLKEQLPNYMIPSAFVTLEAMPLTPNGKIDRRALPELEGHRFQSEITSVMPRTEMEQHIAQIWQRLLQIETVGINDNFFDLGGHSLLIVRVQSELSELLKRDLSIVELFQYPTIKTLTKHLTQGEIQETSEILKTPSVSSDSKDIAIIGMAGRFPGAKNLEIFWQNLCEGVESITFFSDEELLESGISPTLLNNPNYVKANGILEDIELFDAAFFDYNPREAEFLDPQQRLFIECAWEAIENAGYDVERLKYPMGVYAGVGINSYLLNNLYPHQELVESFSYQLAMSNDKDFLPTRVSYKLNLQGPSVNIQTACSTSLVAVHMACQSLLNNECYMALAGGVKGEFPQQTGYLYKEDMIMSPDGHCRAFDAKAQGTIGGNGVGIVVLKKLEQALADGDYIQAVIKGSAINNDGSLKVGYTAPSVDGQTNVIAAAMRNLDYETISYIEAHGTGTTLGDPIEVAALTQAYKYHTQKQGFCAIGSVKSNVGHLDAAAGVTGLIKTVLALKHKRLPPSLHFEQPNPRIDFANSPFFVNNQLSEWKSADNIPRRAGVSSFGIGGTNAHLVVEEAPVISEPLSGNNESSDTYLPWHLLGLSAKTSTALEQATANLAEYLTQHPNINLADVAYTLSVGRKVFEHRRLLVCRSSDEAIEALNTLEPKRVFTQIQSSKEQPVVFMFSGQGSQYVNMGLELYQQEPLFHAQIDKCAEILKPYLNLDLRNILYPSAEENDEAAHKLEQTAITQPALFVFEYALAQLWMAWGLRPVAMIGHSIGEYVAACLARVFTLEEALILVATRGQLMQELPRGAMLSVPLPESKIQSFLNQEISLAAHNAPDQCVVSGTSEAITKLKDQLAAQKIECRHLKTSHAFHSAMMEAVMVPFAEQVKKIQLNPPQIPYLSNLSGTWITAEQATDSDYWSKHLRQTVRFAEELQELLKKPEYTLLEIGPGRALTTFARRHPDKTNEQVTLTSVRHPKESQEDVAFLLTTVGQLWLAGVPIDWSAFYAQQQCQRVPLPTYPFERQRYWIEAPTEEERAPQRAINKKADIADWFYLPVWQQSMSPTRSQQLESLNWLVFEDNCGLGTQLVQKLKQAGQEVITVKVGSEFEQLDDHGYVLNPQQLEDYHALFTELNKCDKIPQAIIHLWTVTPNEHPSSRLKELEYSQNLGLYSLLFIAQALGKQEITQKIAIEIVSNHIQAVTSEEVLCPEKATLLGAVKIIPQEYPNFKCRHIDVVVPHAETKSEQILVEQLWAELTTKSSDLMIAYRGFYRWVPTFKPTRLEEPLSNAARLREKGVYLITGGFGGMGLTFAEYLAKTLRAKLILIGRSPLPPRSEWERWLSTHDELETVSLKLRKVQNLENLGAEVLVASADVANLEQMQTVIAQAEQQWGQINGVIHCAGVIDEAGMIARRTRETTESVLAPKVKGTLILDNLLKEVKLDFFVLCSSIGSIFYRMKFGEVGYCAANDFLDAFAYYKTLVEGTFTVAINWNDWQEVGMSVTSIKKQLDNAAHITDEQAQSLLKEELTLSPSQGVEVLRRILESTYPRVAVSTQDPLLLVEQYNALTVSELKLGKDNILQSTHQRPELNNAYVAPRDELELEMTEIWQQLLGINQLGIFDDFLDLGGDSLLATQLISKIRETFDVVLPLAIFFENATIAEISLKILAKQLEQLEKEEMEQLVSDVQVS
jgi:amino acid adenylation domain-containing protein